MKKSLQYILMVTFLFAPLLVMAEEVPCKTGKLPPPCYDVNDATKFNKPALILSKKGVAFFYKQQKFTGIIPWYTSFHPDERKGVSKKKIAHAIEAIVLTKSFQQSGLASLSPATRRTLEVYLHALSKN